ncbi:hypothetical protein LCGC14_1475330 [marine sediment metagenome]|uniref:Uncharacterized protein n=1 Tax=marine sediment metagenome TaxID=412755 RepID=A0A0F9MCU3_9ZZZZ
MKRILVFLGLKVAEIGGVFGIFIVSSYLFRLFNPEENYWAAGILGMLIGFIAISACIFTIVFSWEGIKKNWQWSKRITDK